MHPITVGSELTEYSYSSDLLNCASLCSRTGRVRLHATLTPQPNCMEDIDVHDILRYLYAKHTVDPPLGWDLGEHKRGAKRGATRSSAQAKRARHHESLALVVADETVVREAGEALRAAVEPHDRLLQV